MYKWYVFNLFGGEINWMRKRYSTVALSTIEVEYMVATHARKEAIYLYILYWGIGLVQWAVRINYDSQSEIFLEKNPTCHSNTNNIDAQYHFVRDMIEEKKMMLVKVDTPKNIMDSLTKFVITYQFFWYRKKWKILPWIVDHVLLCPPRCKGNNKWENVWYVLYSLNDYPHMLYFIRIMRGHMGG